MRNDVFPKRKCFWHLDCLLLIAVCHVPLQEIRAQEALNYSVRSYAEAASLETEGSSVVFSTKVLKPVKKQFSVYTGAQVERYAPTAGSVERVSPLAGLEIPIGRARGFAEYRHVEEWPQSARSASDPRVGVTGGYWAQEAFAKTLSFFSDSYFECVAVPRFSFGPGLAGFSKAGLRVLMARASQRTLSVDTYLEAYGRESADPALGRAALEARVGARAVMASRNWSAQFSAFRRFISFRDAPDARLSALFSLGGEF